MAKGFVLEKTKGQMPAPLAALAAMEKGCNRTLDEGLGHGISVQFASWAPPRTYTT